MEERQQNLMERVLRGYERLINGKYGVEYFRDKDGKLQEYKFHKK